MKPTLKQQLGCWLYERWQLELALRFPSLASSLGCGKFAACNRHERVRKQSLGGYECDWRFTSELTACRFFPLLGRRLLDACFQEWPLRFSSNICIQEQPAVSFLVAVRGTNRLPQFKAVLSSLMGQRDCPVEIIVVEQSHVREFVEHIPEGVRYVHTSEFPSGMPFNKSWALNVAARHASGRYLVIHDADMVVPCDYASRIREVLDAGFDAMLLPRFLFYLNEDDSRRFLEKYDGSRIESCGRVVQNNPTPIAIRAETFWKIGGMDESFFGWGGEDDEFVDRLSGQRFYRGMCFPMIHLWHEEAPKTFKQANEGIYHTRIKLPVGERIRELNARNQGQGSPSIPWEQADGGAEVVSAEMEA